MSFRIMVQYFKDVVQDDQPGDEVVLPSGSFPQ